MLVEKAPKQYENGTVEDDIMSALEEGPLLFSELCEKLSERSVDEVESGIMKLNYDGVVSETGRWEYYLVQCE